MGRKRNREPGESEREEERVEVRQRVRRIEKGEKDRDGSKEK